jgi:adenine-specific DNA-methyltransferase
MPQYVKSPLNYTGGKYRLLPQINKYLPAKIGTFYDVFCGGANVGINAQAEEIVCLDNDPRVIQILQLIQSKNHDELNQKILEVIAKHNLSQSFLNGYSFYDADSSKGLGKHNKQGYLELRRTYNSTTDIEEKHVLLLVLIIYGFNNQIRFNSKGEYNLPVGKRDYNGSVRKNLAHFNFVATRKNISFRVGDFRELQNHNFAKDDFIYLDPPYLLGTATYNENGGWSVRHEEDLYGLLDQLHNKKVRFALSNVIEHKGKTNEILKYWAQKNNYIVNHLDFHYKNSNYQSTAKQSSTTEVLITNYCVPSR